MFQIKLCWSLDFLKRRTINTLNYPVVIFISLSIDSCCWDLLIAWDSCLNIVRVKILSSQNVLKPYYILTFHLLCKWPFFLVCSMLDCSQAIVIIIWLEACNTLLEATLTIWNIVRMQAKNNETILIALNWYPFSKFWSLRVEI